MSGKIKSAYRRSKAIYDDVLTQSKWWSRLYISLFWKIDDIKIAGNLLNMFPDGFNGKLLDVPCGTLNLTAVKYNHMKNADIICLDYSEDMLEKARERIKEFNLESVFAVQGDVGCLPYPDDSFDIVLSMNGFHVFPDKLKAYQETARVLKPGGMFCGCFYVRGEYAPSDFAVNVLLSKKGWFTPPFQSKDEVRRTLSRYYRQTDVQSDKAMIWFKCVK